MKFHAITTFNQAGLELYGRRMLSSFDEYWPDEVKLTVYAEGWSVPLARAETLDLEASSPWLRAFKERHRNRRVADYRFDAVRFAHKVAALTHAVKLTDADVLIWIDGDVFTHSPLALADLEEMAPKGEEWIAWLDRARMHPECGFYMLNCAHPWHRQAMADFEVMYTSDALFNLAEFHDSHVLEKIVQMLALPTKSLSGDARGTHHPAERGPLAQWIEHAKGSRKHRQRRRARA